MNKKLGLLFALLFVLCGCGNKYEMIGFAESKIAIVVNRQVSETRMETFYNHYQYDGEPKCDETFEWCILAKKYYYLDENLSRDFVASLNNNLNKLEKTEGSMLASRYTLMRIENDNYWAFFYKDYLIVEKDDEMQAYAYNDELKEALDYYLGNHPTPISDEDKEKLPRSQD